LDTERAKLAFGFVAQVDFKQGLRNTIDWYQQQLGRWDSNLGMAGPKPAACWRRPNNFTLFILAASDTKCQEEDKEKIGEGFPSSPPPLFRPDKSCRRGFLPKLLDSRR